MSRDGAAVLYLAGGSARRLSALQTAEPIRSAPTSSPAAAAWRSLVRRLRANFGSGGRTAFNFLYDGGITVFGDQDGREFCTNFDIEAHGRLTPNLTAVLSRRPLLSWHPLPDADRYRVVAYTVTVANDRLAQYIISQLWESVADESPLYYPNSAPDLHPGGYYLWEVRASVDGEDTHHRVGVAGFTVLMPTEADHVRREARQLKQQLVEEAALPLAALYVQHQLVALAIETLERERQAERAGPAVELWLGMLYGDWIDASRAKERLEAARPALTKAERGLWRDVKVESPPKPSTSGRHTYRQARPDRSRGSPK